MGNAGVVEASVEETGAVHVEAAVGVEAASVHGGVGVDAAVDGPQAIVEEELGVSLSLTLPASTPSACAPGASAPGASAPSAPGAAAPAGLSISLTLEDPEARVDEASVVETISVEAAVHGGDGVVHGGVGVDAAVDGPQAVVEEELGVSLSLTLPASTPSACAPGSSAPGASAPARSASPGPTTPTGLSGGNSQEAEKLCKRVIIQ